MPNVSVTQEPYKKRQERTHISNRASEPLGPKFAFRAIRHFSFTANWVRWWLNRAGPRLPQDDGPALFVRAARGALSFSRQPGIMAHVFGSRSTICQYKGVRGRGSGAYQFAAAEAEPRPGRLVILNTRKSAGEGSPFPKPMRRRRRVAAAAATAFLLRIMLDKLTIQSSPTQATRCA